MEFAVLLPAASTHTADPGWVSGFAQHAEQCGFESVVAIEHTVVIDGYRSAYPYDPSGRMDLAPDCPIPDPLDLLAYLAGRTSRIGLATGVLVLPNHHPVVLAKRAATIDALSNGRLRLAVGMGWMAEEIEACGVDFASRGRRADRIAAFAPYRRTLRPRHTPRPLSSRPLTSERRNQSIRRSHSYATGHASRGGHRTR